MDRIPVCKVCLEPISNFICPDCLYKAIQQWVWKSCPALVGRFKSFHKDFLQGVVSEKTATCVVCKNEYYHMVCSYDYMKEVYSWLEGLVNEQTLKDFLRIFGLGFRRIDNRARGWFFYRNRAPFPENDTAIDMGFCEICENFSYMLKEDASNQMVCENCR